MSIRKTGAATGHVTGVEEVTEGGGISVTAARRAPGPAWDGEREAALAQENEAADGE